MNDGPVQYQQSRTHTLQVRKTADALGPGCGCTVCMLCVCVCDVRRERRLSVCLLSRPSCSITLIYTLDRAATTIDTLVILR